MNRLMRGIPAAVLLATGLLGVVLGPLLPPLAAANNGPSAGRISPESLRFGAALFIGGVAILWVARGVWRSKLWRTRVAMLVSVAALAHLVAALPRSLTAGAWVFDASGHREPRYDGRAGIIVISIVLYSVALICLLVGEHRQATTKDVSDLG